jgi:predicted RNase H-like HicB family nuclease
VTQPNDTAPDHATVTYTAVLTPAENGWIGARVLEMPEAISQGRTLEQAKANLADANATVLAVRLEEGEPIPPSGQVTVSPITVAAPRTGVALAGREEPDVPAGLFIAGGEGPGDMPNPKPTAARNRFLAFQGLPLGRHEKRPAGTTVRALTNTTRAGHTGARRRPVGKRRWHRLPAYRIEELVGDLPDPEPPTATRRAPGSGGRTDPYKRIVPPEYFARMAGITVPARGLVSCPAKGHVDRHPSCSVGADPGSGWCCHASSCGARGAIYDLASVLDGGPWGRELRGDAFTRARARVREAFGSCDDRDHRQAPARQPARAGRHRAVRRGRDRQRR